MTSIHDHPSSSSGLSLAVRLRDGSTEAWRELVELYGPLVDSWCRQAGLSGSARARVGQEVFISVHRGIRKFDPELPNATFRGWMWRITRNAVLQWLRRTEPMAAGGSTALGRLNAIPGRWNQTSEDDEASSTHETASLLRRAMEQIRPTVEPQAWSAFWNTAVLGASAPEIAEELGISAAAVRQAKSRMLRRLRLQLGDR
jgi:RNA polymerase sigma-70 factor, ECF subfamily